MRKQIGKGRVRCNDKGSAGFTAGKYRKLAGLLSICAIMRVLG